MPRLPTRPPGKRSQPPPPRIHLTAEKLAAALGQGPPRVMPQGAYALPSSSQGAAPHPVRALLASQDVPKLAGDRSILDPETPEKGAETGQTGVGHPAADMGFLREVFTSTRHKIAAAQQRFWSFVLPNGETLAPHTRDTLVKEALAAQPLQPVHPAFAQSAPTLSQSPPAAFSAPPATQGASPVAPGHSTMTGVAQRPIGLDQPMDTRAAALPGTPGHAATNVIDQRGALDPRGLTVDGNNSSSVQKFASFSVANWFQEKQALSMGDVAHHLPRIRPLDTAIGAGLGAGAGALSAVWAKPDEEGQKPWLSRALGGAALGAGAANLVGDRARRYLSNKLPMYGYSPEKAKAALIPKDWNDFYQAAILDQRQFKRGVKPEALIRREFLRRGMDLPPVSQGAQPFLESTGVRPYTPTDTSGGLPGSFEHVQFSPEGWKRYLETSKYIRPGDAARAYNNLVDPPEALKGILGHTPPADAGESVGKSYAGRAWYDLLSRHGYRNNSDGTTSVHDLWDFALSPQEKKLGIRTLLGQEGPLNTPYSPEVQKANNVGNWRSTLDIDPIQAQAPKGDIIKSLLNRIGLQALTNGGVVFDQRFDAQGEPVFQKRSAHQDDQQRQAGPGRFITMDEIRAYGKKDMEWMRKGHGPRKCRECGLETQCRCPTSVHGSLVGRMIGPEDCWKCRERVAAENTSPEPVAKTAEQRHVDATGTYDIDALIQMLTNQPTETIPLESLGGINRSRSTGFSQRRYNAADPSYPLIVDQDNQLFDGRHRAAKLQDAGATDVTARRAMPEQLAQVKVAAHETWIGVDLDGTLAKYNGWKGKEHIGEPIPLMVNRVKDWLAAGKDVRIMTARVAGDPDAEKHIKAWCKEHLGQELPVTNEKDHGMEELWDDRAHRVEKNTGVKLAQLDPAFLATDAVQNLLRSLGMRSTPAGSLQAVAPAR